MSQTMLHLYFLDKSVFYIKHQDLIGEKHFYILNEKFTQKLKSQLLSTDPHADVL